MPYTENEKTKVKDFFKLMLEDDIKEYFKFEEKVCHTKSNENIIKDLQEIEKVKSISNLISKQQSMCKLFALKATSEELLYMLNDYLTDQLIDFRKKKLNSIIEDIEYMIDKIAEKARKGLDNQVVIFHRETNLHKDRFIVITELIWHLFNSFYKTETNKIKLSCYYDSEQIEVLTGSIEISIKEAPFAEIKGYIERYFDSFLKNWCPLQKYKDCVFKNDDNMGWSKWSNICTLEKIYQKVNPGFALQAEHPVYHSNKIYVNKGQLETLVKAVYGNTNELNIPSTVVSGVAIKCNISKDEVEI
jgi:hypothetical protein